MGHLAGELPKPLVEPPENAKNRSGLAFVVFWRARAPEVGCTKATGEPCGLWGLAGSLKAMSSVCCTDQFCEGLGVLRIEAIQRDVLKVI